MNRIALFLASLSLVSCATKPWMVGSKNDCLKCCGPFARVPGGVWVKDMQTQEVIMEETVSEKNPVRVIK